MHSFTHTQFLILINTPDSRRYGKNSKSLSECSGTVFRQEELIDKIYIIRSGISFYGLLISLFLSITSSLHHFTGNRVLTNYLYLQAILVLYTGNQAILSELYAPGSGYGHLFDNNYTVFGAQQYPPIRNRF